MELAHEALLREWPRLRGWLEEDAKAAACTGGSPTPRASGRERPRTRRAVPRRAPGHRARVAGRPRARPQPHRAGVPGGRARREQRTPRRARRRRAFTLAAVVLVVVTGISTILAVRGIQRARLEERAAASRNLATQAAAHADDDVALAALLGLEAYRREPTVEARSAVLSVLPALGAIRQIGGPLEHGVRLQAVAVSPDGRLLATGTDDGKVWLWDTRDRRRLGPPLAGHAGAVLDVAFSPDGTLVASAGEDRMVRLWDVGARRAAGRPLAGHGAAVTSVEFSPDGRTLASGAERRDRAVVGRARAPVRSGRRHRRGTGASTGLRQCRERAWPSSPGGAWLASAGPTSPCGCGTSPQAARRPAAAGAHQRCGHRDQPRRQDPGERRRLRRCGCGTWPRAARSADRSSARPATSTAWPSARTARRWRSRTASRRRPCGCGARRTRRAPWGVADQRLLARPLAGPRRRRRRSRVQPPTAGSWPAPARTAPCTCGTCARRATARVLEGARRLGPRRGLRGPGGPLASAGLDRTARLWNTGPPARPARSRSISASARWRSPPIPAGGCWPSPATTGPSGSGSRDAGARLSPLEGHDGPVERRGVQP